MPGPVTTLVLRAHEAGATLRAAVAVDWAAYVADSLAASPSPHRFLNNERARSYVEKSARILVSKL